MASSEEYASWIIANKDKRGTPEFDKVSQAYQLSKQQNPEIGQESMTVSAPKAPDDVPGKVPDTADKLMANPVTRFALGAAEPIIGAGQKIAHGFLPNPEIAKWYDENMVDRPKRMINAADPKGSGISLGDITSVAGNVMNPISLKLAKLLPVANTAGQRILQGAEMGGVNSALMPVENAGGDDIAGRTLMNAFAGSALGAAAPAAWEGSKLIGRGVRNLVQPFLGKSGLDKASGRVANIAAGDRANEVTSSLEKAKDIVPGSRLTAGQAAVPANSAEFSALQDIASKAKPSSYYGPSGVKGQQESARLAQIQQISGGADDTALNNAIAMRKSLTDPLYASVEKSKAKVDARDALLEVNKILKKSGNIDNIRIPLENIKNKLIIGDNGKIIELEKNPQALASLSQNIKILMGTKTANGQPEYDVKVLSGIKDILDEAIGKAEPNYAKARNLYKESSLPINQMRIGKELESKLLNPSGKETPGSYLKALDDSSKILKDATGFSRYKDIGQVLKEKTPLATDVAKDLENNVIYNDLSSKGMNAAKERIGEATDAYKGIGILKTPIVITNAIINRLEGKSTKHIVNNLAERMQDPKEMARIMKAAKPFERQALVDAFMKYQGTAAGGIVADQ